MWAPLAGSLEAVLAAGPVPLRRAGPDGEWVGELPVVGADADYLLRVDGHRLLPDPRSRWQPAGAAGPTRPFDPSRHCWRDGGWAGVSLPGGVVYELHVATFTPAGTLDAAAARLDHLVRLGVDAVELMPLGVAPGPPGWGYDCALPDAVRAEYGGPAALQRFVDASHACGLGVVLDVVYNHLGPRGAPHKHLAPYFAPARRTPWGKAMNLAGPGSAGVRRWIIDSALSWLRDFHLDGLRLDAAHHLNPGGDGSERPVLAVLADRVAELSQRTGVPRWLVGELRPTRPAAVRPTAAGGLGLHAQWDKAPGQSARQLIDQRLPRPRRTAALAEVVAGYRSPAGAAAVTALQDHDIVGNSPTGARLGSVASVGLAAAAAAIMLTLPTTALLFMGEEWAATSPFGYFVGFEDPQLLVAVRAGRRRELVAAGWTGEMADPGDPATRAAAVLDWAEPGRWPHRDLLAWYRTLLTLRRAGAWRVSDVDDGGLVLTLDGPARLVVNAGDTSARVALPGPGCTLITLGATLRPDPDRRHTEVPARSAALLR